MFLFGLVLRLVTEPELLEKKGDNKRKKEKKLTSIK
jgi:hypothetical protein